MLLRPRPRSFAAALLTAALAFACGGVPDQGAAQDDLAGATRLRIVAANLTSGNNQSYTPGDGLRILQGLHADVMLVQEFNIGGNSAAEVQSFANAACGAPCFVAREAGALQIPNGIVSRYPIKSSGRWVDANVGNRGFAWARIDIPGAHDLWAVSVHLLTSSAANRDAEAAQLVADLRQAVPAGDYVVLGGDFNTAARTEAALSTLSAVLAIPTAYPADLAGNSNTNQPRSKPDDWVLVNAPLQALSTPVAIGANRFAAGLVADTRVYTPIADLSPALAGDSGASNMQHNAVVRDFAIAPDDAVLPDGGVRDGGSADAGHPDAGHPDAGQPDAGQPDAGPADGGHADGGLSDGGSGDAGTPDAGSDPYEPDDTAAAARPLLFGVAQTHDISPKSDQDWLTFTLAAPANIAVETSGPAGGDTYVRLLDSGSRELAHDDDSGAGNYSLLRRPALPAGKYFVVVTSYAGASVIRGYTARVSTY